VAGEFIFHTHHLHTVLLLVETLCTSPLRTGHTGGNAIAAASEHQ
jgi:hypothetical protein